MSIVQMQRDELVLKHLPLVRRVASRMSARYPSSVELDDLVSIGTLGLIDAAQRFDPERHSTFTSYALIRIKGAIVDALRKLDWVPRTVRARNRSLEEARQTIRLEGRHVDAENLARYLGVDLERLAQIERDAVVLTQVSMWERRANSDQPIAETLPSNQEGPTEHLDREDVRQNLLSLLSTLNRRDQEIVRMYYFQELPFREIGERLGVTESRVSQLHSRIKRRLRDALGDEITPATATAGRVG